MTVELREMMKGYALTGYKKLVEISRRIQENNPKVHLVEKNDGQYLLTIDAIDYFLMVEREMGIVQRLTGNTLKNRADAIDRGKRIHECLKEYRGLVLRGMHLFDSSDHEAQVVHGG